MTIKMEALKQFRLPQNKGFKWLSVGESYTVETDANAEYHVKSGRGVRIVDPAKSMKKGV